MEALVTYFGNLDRIFNTDAGTLMGLSGMTTDIANKISNANRYLNQAREYYGKLKGRDIKITTRFDQDYPERLNELNDPPSLLYYRGKLFTERSKLVSIAGAEAPTEKGIELTTALAKKMSSAGVEILSSLNPGIDAAAHLGGKPLGGISHAVLDTGFDDIYPEENRPLAVDIVKSGSLITEYSPDEKYEPKNYKMSNRLIVAMSQAVVITEFYKDNKRVWDLLTSCSQVGKITFILINPEYGGLTDEDSLNHAVTCGAIPMVGLDKIEDIISSLV